MTPAVAALTDRQLLDEVTRLAAGERQQTAALIAVLAEIDTRRLYLGEGFSSLFAYCTEVLHLSEHAAYGRIEAARTARTYPAVLRMIADGEVTLTSLSLVAPHLTAANHVAVLESIRHKSKREVERIVAGLAPKPDVPSSIRKLPAPTVSGARQNEAALLTDIGSAARSAICRNNPDSGPVAQPAPCEPVVSRAPAQRPVITPLAPERYKLQLTIGHATHDKLRRAQDLLRHAIPDGDPAEVLDRALTMLVAHLEKQKTAAATDPRLPGGSAPTGRTIPAVVRRAVWRRDKGQCAFVGAQGRCTATAFLELHHVLPFAHGGPATEDNIELRCRAHNQYEARLDFPHVLRERPPIYDGASRSENAWLMECM